MDTSILAAGLSDGKIRTSDGEIYDIKAIVSASGDPEQDEIEIKGDDQKLATFVMGQGEDITITANSLPFDVIQAITGNTMASSATGLRVNTGTDSQSNPPFVEVYATSQAKNSDGTMGTFRKTWHKVQFYNIGVTQEGETEFSIEIRAKAYQTDVDIEGDALDEAKIATLEFVTS